MVYIYPDQSCTGPKDFIANNGCQYSADIFSNGTPIEELVALGVKPFREEFVPAGFWGGVFVDVENELEVVRTYPNPVAIPFYAENKRIAEITIKLAALDVFVPRSVEEIFAALPECGLSDINKQRVAEKTALRAELAELKAEVQ